MISSINRTSISLLLIPLIDVFLLFKVIDNWPSNTEYLDIRVYNQFDAPDHYLTGSVVTLHSRTEGETYRVIVDENGGAKFSELEVPTIINYQVEYEDQLNSYFATGNSSIINLPEYIVINVDTLLKYEILEVTNFSELNSIDTNYREDFSSLETENAPWGVPSSDKIISRLGYVLGFNTDKSSLDWVAYSIGPTSSIEYERPNFMLDPAIDFESQAHPDDYRNSGYDRGHLISPIDLLFKGPITADEAYYMSTVAPQTPWLNRFLWREIEQRTRDRINSELETAFIIAGPIYENLDLTSGANPETIGDNRILIPSHFFRIARMPKTNGDFEFYSIIVPNS